MSQDIDLDATVDDVKQQIRDAENPDYKALLEAEEAGKDRKTVKDFLQSRIDSEEVEVEDAEDDLVEQIEEDTRGGLLGGFSREALLAAGLAGGLLVGLMFGLVVDFYEAEAEISSSEAQDRVESIVELEAEEYEFTDDPEIVSGMYYVPMELTQTFEEGNETQTEDFEQAFYLTTDGVYLFPEQQDPMTGETFMPIDIDAQIEMFEQQPDPEEMPEEGEMPEEELEEGAQEELPEDLEEELGEIEVE